jgi:hypothetical protein
MLATILGVALALADTPLAAAPPSAAAPAEDACAPLHAALARLYHVPLRHKSVFRRTDGQEKTTEYVLTGDRQYTRFPDSEGWIATPLGEADRAVLDDGLKNLTAREGLVCAAEGQEMLGAETTARFLIDDEQAHTKTSYWVGSGLVLKSVIGFAHGGASLTDTYDYTDVKAPR